MRVRTKRHLRIGFALAVLAAAGWGVAAQAQQNPAPAEKPKAEMRSLRREMARDLFDITPEQEKKLRELREADRKDRLAFRDEMVKMRGEMRGLMKDPAANAAKIDKLIDSRARLRAKGEKQALRSRGERDKIFTPEQREKMRKYRDLFRERFAAREGRRSGMGPGARRWRRAYDPWIWY